MSQGLALLESLGLHGFEESDPDQFKVTRVYRKNSEGLDSYGRIFSCFEDYFFIAQGNPFLDSLSGKAGNRAIRYPSIETLLRQSLKNLQTSIKAGPEPAQILPEELFLFRLMLGDHSCLLPMSEEEAKYVLLTEVPINKRVKLFKMKVKAEDVVEFQDLPKEWILKIME